MIVFLTIIHVAVCLFLILVVLLQTGKGADLAGAFGGGGSQTAFGARGATTLLHKITTASAVVFMATSLILAIISSSSSSSVVTDSDQPVPVETGAAPVELEQTTPILEQSTPEDGADVDSSTSVLPPDDAGAADDAGTSPAEADPEADPGPS